MSIALKSATSSPLVVGFVSLGCPKNLVDSERMLASLALEGFVVTGDVNVADVAIVNTCAFIADARRESGQAIENLLKRKRRGKLQMVVVAGCYPQLDREEILDEWPDVDAVVGVAERDRIGRLLRRLARTAGESPLVSVPYFGKTLPPDIERLRLTPPHYTYLKVAEGCNNRCTYCSIPRIRGPLRSKPLAAIVAEAGELVADGARELILIGQDTTAYGHDLGGDLGISEVLARLNRIPGLRWIRLLYTHPAHFPDSLLRAYADLERLVPYVDLPLQHVAQPVLDSMGRKTTRARIEKLIDALRRARPDMAIRSTFIVGYPGETDGHFDALLNFVRQVCLDRLGAFAYSPEPGTRAADLPDQVPDKVKQQRLRQLMALQKKIAVVNHHRLVGKKADAVIDSVLADRRKPARGRLWSQAPLIDGVTTIRSRAPLRPGQILSVKITGAGPYDLEAAVTAR